MAYEPYVPCALGANLGTSSIRLVACVRSTSTADSRHLFLRPAADYFCFMACKNESFSVKAILLSCDLGTLDNSMIRQTRHAEEEEYMPCCLSL